MQDTHSYVQAFVLTQGTWHVRKWGCKKGCLIKTIWEESWNKISYSHLFLDSLGTWILLFFSAALDVEASSSSAAVWGTDASSWAGDGVVFGVDVRTGCVPSGFMAAANASLFFVSLIQQSPRWFCLCQGMHISAHFELYALKLDF